MTSMKYKVFTVVCCKSSKSLYQSCLRNFSRPLLLLISVPHSLSSENTWNTKNPEDLVPFFFCLMSFKRKKVNMFPVMEKPRKPVVPVAVHEHAGTTKGQHGTYTKQSHVLAEDLFV